MLETIDVLSDTPSDTPPPMFPYTLGQVRDWLESLAPDEVAGIACDENRCPLSNFLLFKGVAEPDVQQGSIGFLSADHPDLRHWIAPEWVDRFIVLVDQCSGDVMVLQNGSEIVVPRNGRRVTVAESLRALEAAAKEAFCDD